MTDERLGDVGAFIKAQRELATDTAATDAGSAYIFDPNLNPVANPDTVELPMSHYNVKANDADADDDALTVTGVGAATHGVATLHSDNTVSYTPNATFTGTEGWRRSGWCSLLLRTSSGR